jgi:hypothetical protein
LVRLAVAALAVEIVYLIAANAFLQTGLIFSIINKRPQRMLMEWESAWTYLPGFVKVRGFTLRNQDRKNQIYVAVGEAHAVISLFKLPFKTIHVRKVNAHELDFRLRPRLDAIGSDGSSPHAPEDAEHFPDIPGLSNPPEEKPEELYPRKKKPPRPWGVKLGGVKVQGPILASLGRLSLAGNGVVGGSMTLKPKETITIHRARLRLEPLRITLGPELLTEDLELRINARFRPFPLKGAKVPEIIGGLSGTIGVVGNLGERAAFESQITPGIAVKGSGQIDADLKLKKGVLQSGSDVSLHSERFAVQLMDLEFMGAAEVTGRTAQLDGRPATSATIRLAEYSVSDPADGSAHVTGDGLVLDASWNQLSFAERTPASTVTIVLPQTEIHDLAIINSLMPPQRSLTFDSGTGEMRATLHVDDGLAAGELHLSADDVIMDSRGDLHHADLTVHTVLAEGDLEARHFNFSGTTIRVDDIAGDDATAREQKKFGDWFCDFEVERGEITFGRPLAVDGRFTVAMFDIRPIIALLKDLGKSPGWLFLVPNVKDVNGTLDLTFGADQTSVDHVTITGKGLEVLGWMDLKKKNSNGRIFLKHGMLAAGFAMTDGKGKIILSKPRKWFEAEESNRSSSATADPDR